MALQVAHVDIRLNIIAEYTPAADGDSRGGNGRGAEGEGELTPSAIAARLRSAARRFWSRFFCDLLVVAAGSSGTAAASTSEAIVGACSYGS